MVDVRGLFSRAKTKDRGVADAVPPGARRAAARTRRTAAAVGEVLDERTGGRAGEVVDAAGQVVDRAVRTTGQAREAFRDEASAPAHRPDRYRPDPIDPPSPIDRPEPV